MSDLILRTGKSYKVSEVFFSFQGEGFFTGVPTLWVRSFGCNLECPGFGQDDPTDSESYDLPYLDYDVDNILAVEDLPVWSKGCDSSYSWAKKYRHLVKDLTAEQIVDQWVELLKHETNPEGKFIHPVTEQAVHICFTGGEPMMNQKMIVDVLTEVFRRDDVYHPIVTIETNGTRPLSPEFKSFIDSNCCSKFDLLFSISPKLFSVSGEPNDRAIRPDVIAEYQYYSSFMSLKYVVNRNAWDELTEVHQRIIERVGTDATAWVMPVGATTEAQDQVAADIAIEAMKRGFNVAARVHCYVFGNKIGF